MLSKLIMKCFKIIAITLMLNLDFTTTMSLSDADIERRICAAQKIQLNLDEATGPRISRFVTDYASSIGSPKEFFLLPVQSIAAYFMGPKTTVKVHEGWSEPVIVWAVVMAHKGQKKSPALGCFHRELCKMEEDLISSENESEEKQPQIFVEHFSFEELHYTMKKNNNCRIIGLYYMTSSAYYTSNLIDTSLDRLTEKRYSP